jgi:predicted aminopeptidase
VNARRRRYKTIAQTFVAAAMAAALGGCATLGYYAHLAAGEMSVLRARRPIPQVIADPRTPPALRARLELAVRARTFASDTLRLRWRRPDRRHAVPARRVRVRTSA